MRILFVPDSIWGDASGHRSSQYLVKAFSKIGVNMAVYAPSLGQNQHQKNLIDSYKCKVYIRSEYRYKEQIFRDEIDKEFKSICKEFKPDYVFYVGTIKNKTSIDICIKENIKYLYLPLTTEYYCINTFAGIETGPCYGCIKGSLFAPLKVRCLSNDFGMINFVKDKAIEKISRKRVLNAYRIVGYSNDQLSLLEQFGVQKGKRLKLPIFFDPDSDNQIKRSKGNYFLIFGQFLTAKGWHLIPEIIKKTKNTKFKVILKKSNFKTFIHENELEYFIENKSLVLQDFLETHQLLLEEVAKSKGVLIPSYYDTTGEFTMLEALMFHKPVIAFKCGIHKEIFKDRKNGLVADIGDIEGYCKRIEEVNSNQELYETVSKGAKNLFNKITSFRVFEEQVCKNL